MRNASGHQGKNERQRKKVNRTTYNISSIKRATRKFLEVSRYRCSKQRQRNVPKKPVHSCSSCCFFVVSLLWDQTEDVTSYENTFYDNSTMASFHHSLYQNPSAGVVVFFFLGKLGLLFSNPSEIDNSGSCRQMSSS